MKAILKFDLSDPEDRTDHYRCVRARDMASFIWDFQQYLREQVKYNEKDVNQREIYEKWFEYLNDADINLDNLIR